jgi:hypothetical protein
LAGNGSLTYNYEVRAVNTRTGSQICWILSLVANVQYVNARVPDHEQDLIRIVQSLTNRFCEESILVRYPALFSRCSEIAYGSANSVVPLGGMV